MSDVRVDKKLLGPVLAGFFIMGFSDIVAPITNYIAADLPDAPRGAVSFLPTMVFLWFLLLSTPVAVLMNRWGRKRMTLVGYAFTVAGLMTPYAAGSGCSLGWYFAGFGLLGIGATVVQVAVNPLLATIVPAERMSGYFTRGQVARNTSLLLMAPLVTGLVAWTGSWRLMLPVYAILTVVCGVWLQLTAVPERGQTLRTAGFGSAFRLLGNGTVLLATLGVAASIATDVGAGFLSVRLIDAPSSILTTTGFYACRIVGTLVGVGVLMRFSDVKYLRWNMTVALVLGLLLLFVRNEAAIYAAFGLFGFTMACAFSVFYAAATKAAPGRANDVAGLAVMSIAAGAVSAPACHALIRVSGNPHMGMLFVVGCVVYMLYAAWALETRQRTAKQNDC